MAIACGAETEGCVEVLADGLERSFLSDYSALLFFLVTWVFAVPKVSVSPIWEVHGA